MTVVLDGKVIGSTRANEDGWWSLAIKRDEPLERRDEYFTAGGGLHASPKQSRAPRNGADAVADFHWRIQAKRRELARLGDGNPGAGKLKRQIRAMEHGLVKKEYGHKSQGDMGRLQGFEDRMGKSSRGQAAHEKIKTDGGSRTPVM